MQPNPRVGPAGALSRLAWWTLCLIVAGYGGFAVWMGLTELGFVLGVAPELKPRAAPLVFAIHALAGAVALFIGPIQSIRWIRRRASLRRTLGRGYVIAVWIASVAALVDVRTFEVTLAAKIVFALTAVIWFATTALGLQRAMDRRFAEQHEWMIRSYSLSLFFVSFSVWVPLLARTSLPPDVGYALALLLSGGLNLTVAELWIRRRPGAVGERAVA